MMAVLQRLPLERVLRLYTPEQVRRVVPPEQRLAGLTEAQIAPALPDAILRALSDEYLATLPQETRTAIRKRIGRG
jgi:hypothetical protein